MSQTGLKKNASELKSNLKQIGLLMWKNFTLQKRGVVGTIIEILVPTLFVLILLPIRRIVKSDQYLNNTIYDSFSIDALPSGLLPEFWSQNFESNWKRDLNEGLWTICYCPNNVDLIEKIMHKVESDLIVSIKGFKTEDEMVGYLTNQSNSKNGLGGVSFLDHSPKNFTYKIRLSYSPRYNQGGLFKKDLDWKTQFIYSLFPILGPRERKDLEGGDPGYYREGFISIQKAIDFALIYQFNKSVEFNELRLKRFPYPPYNDDKFVAVVQALFPFIVMLSFIFTVILTAKAIVYEKETGIKEAMKLMGMKKWVYWLSWYIKTFILLLPGLLFMIIGFKVKLSLKSGGEAAIIDKTDPFLFTIFLFLYASSSITFTFLCSTFFKKANSAAAGAGIIWFFSYLPYIFISLRYEKMTIIDKVLALFVNNLAMSEGLLLIGMFEAKGTGINFSNWNDGLSVNDTFSMTTVLAVMVFNNLVHIALTYYFDDLLPGDHGIGKPWNYPFKSISKFFKKKFSSSESYHSFLDETKSSKNIEKIRDVKYEINGDDNITPVLIEDESIYSNKKIGIKIEKISKKFKQLGKIKQAVDDLSLNIYEGQISVLLGHNGAGKSTTISMITGLTEPTNGRILVNDIDVVKNTKQARKCIGFCPQYNLLFENLTVYEHLKFFSKLKENFDESEIDNMLDLINLKDKKHALSKTLSGGMKRKLCVAIAFIGNSSIVILDEPSSGMDPQARHSTWTLLQKFKKERKCTILLTTHFMDEADFLGDRIAIMSKGSLRCCGSPLFLKSKYGSGYNLVLTKMRSVENSVNHDKEIINLVTRLIPNSSLNTNLTTEISFILPSEETARFSYLLDEIDKNRQNLDIMNVGISVTTIEDVFLKIGEMENIQEIEEIDLNKHESVSNQKTPSLNGDIENSVNPNNNDEFENFGLWAGSQSFDLVKGIRLVFQQFYALIIKRMINTLRNKILILVQIVIPLICLLINLFYLKYGPIKPEDSPALILNLNSYQHNFVPIKLNISSYDKNFNTVSKLAEIYKDYVSTFKSASSFYLENNSSASECAYQRDNIDDYIGCLGRLSLSYIVDENIVATEFTVNEFDEISIIGHFNNQPFHVPPLAVSLITSSLLTFYSNESSKITVINHPLPRNLTDQINDMQSKDVAGFNIATGLTFGLSFLIASFALFLIKERANDAKHVQYLSGCNSYVFWSSALVWDILNYFISVALVPLFLKIFGIEQFIGGNRWMYVIGLLFLYGFSHIPQMYLFSYLFKVPATGFAALVVWNIMSSQATLTPTQILTLPQLELLDVSRLLEWIFLVIFPNFTFGQGMIDLYNNYQITEVCKEFVDLCPYFPNPCCYPYETKNPNKCGVGADCLLWTEDYMRWEKPGLLRFFVFMPLQFIIVFGLILFYEAGYFRYIKYFVCNLFKKDSFEEQNEEQLEIEREYGDIKKDEDVIKEENRISENLINPLEEIFIVDGITKYYSNFMAVKGISFTLKSSECFGLLGVNGAGKSTSFKMLTGDEYLTKGDASINRISIKNDLKKYQKKLGYCPQFDPLIDQMTVMETMTMYARLRGLKPNIIKNTCLSLINLLDLDDHIEKMCFTLSGGNKRKLSVAIALIGSPLVVLLDEPTSGMDPITRRTLWNCLIKIKNKGKSLILTTHSMDETEVLCSNIGIMVNGEFKCIGSLQHLKSKYGEGYTLMVKICLNNKLSETNTHEDRTAIVDGNQILIEKNDESIDKNQKVNQFIEFILDKIKNSYVKENRDGFVNIHINENSTSILSKVFSIIEEIKTQFSIEYYIVTQTKLEQIFLNFASRQIDPETRLISKSNSYCC